MTSQERINILLVDDQPGKLLSYEAILEELGENLIKAGSGREALELLLKNEIAVILVDVCMPELDGFQLAAMIREHPRFQKTAIIFISAIHLTDIDHLRGYEMGAVDYMPVPIVPEVLRAKVRVFADLYRKTRELEVLNSKLEQRVAQRTEELASSNSQLLESERRRSVALVAGQMGSWDWDLSQGEVVFDEGQCRIFGVDRASFVPSLANIRGLIHPEDWQHLREAFSGPEKIEQAHQIEFRIIRPDGDLRWCIGAAAATVDATGRMIRLSGVTVDITDRKLAEERQLLLAREVDHRARNALAVVQAIVRLTQAKNTQAYVDAVEGRIRALAQTHSLLSQSRWQGADIGKLVREELGPYMSAGASKVAMEGPPIYLPPDTAQIIALALHELATNAAKYGALSRAAGRLSVNWQLESGAVALSWMETGGSGLNPPLAQGFGTKIINSSIKRQMGGSVLFDWKPGGLHCRMSIPYGVSKRDGEKAARDNSNLVQFKIGQTKRILLVEDEVLVGMMMRDVLADIGFFVAGPFCTMAEAVSAAQAQQFDGAVLDLNLGGELAYPVADLLRSQGVPFVFVTGYGHDAVDGEFAQVPILQKPIDRESLEHSMRGLVGPPGAQIDGADIAAKTAVAGGVQANL